MNRHDHELATHHTWLRQMARRFARSSARADDLMQDTYVTALRNAPPDAELRPWLRAVMRKLAWGEARSERRRIQREEGFSLITPALTLPQSLLDHGADRERLTEALATLPEPFRSTIVQRFFKGRSCADIARSDNVPAGTVRWRQARGIELLRAELAPRQGRVIWALPFLGAGHQLVTRVWRTLARTAGSKAFWVALALVAAAYMIRASDTVLHPPSADRVAHASLDRVAVANASRGRAGAAGSARERRSREQGAGPLAGLIDAVALGLRGPGADSSSTAPTSIDDALGRHRDDCQWDPVNGWGCPDPTLGSPPTQFATNSSARGGTWSSDTCQGAMHMIRPGAPRTLAISLVFSLLGCSVDASPDGASPARDREPVDHSAAPESPKPPVSPPLHCTSVVADSGLVCSTCEGDAPGTAPECLPALCYMQGDGCLRCVDPKARVATECSVDYRAIPGKGLLGTTVDGAMNLTACQFSYGVPHAAGTTCNFPGPDTCTVSPDEVWETTCLWCRFLDGTNNGRCGATGEQLDPKVDPLVGRPDDLPAPGTCVDDLAADGSVECTTCTHADQSATRTCRYPSITSCQPTEFFDFWNHDLVGCTLEDGSVVGMRYSTRGLRPMPGPVR